MSFQAVTWRWDGKDYTLPADGLLRPIAAVEEIITIGEVARMVSTRQIKFARLAEAVACVLRFAGATVSDREVYAHFMRDSGEHIGEGPEWAYRLLSLMGMLTAPAHLLEGEKDAGKESATGGSTGSSPEFTSSSSASGG